MKNVRGKLVTAGHAEGISYLVLLGIAMPLKYMAGIWEAVRIVGSLHGILFIIFITLLWEGKKRIPLSWKTAFFAFLLSITPFGTFFLGRLVDRGKQG
jgi:integral membrane protein